MFVCSECGQQAAAPGFCPDDGIRLVARGDELLGQSVGSYRLARLIGRGGMGDVYLGVQPQIRSRVAVKLLNAHCADNPALVERFFGEARSVNVIRHEGIVNVLDLARLADGRPYIVMEYLDGSPLSSIFAAGALPLGTAIQLAVSVLEVLAAVHGHGITHRDLKPDNIFVTAAGRTKVLDFGIAKLRPDLGAGDASTRTGAVLGTPHYMSPEQALGRSVDHRADLYSLGIILFEAITGRRPFEGSSLYELLHAHVNLPPPALSSFRADVPPALDQLLLRALAKNPDHRFDSAEAFARALSDAGRFVAPDSFRPLSPSAARPVLQHRAATPLEPTTANHSNRTPNLGPAAFAPTLEGATNTVSPSSSSGSGLSLLLGIGLGALLLVVGLGAVAIAFGVFATTRGAKLAGGGAETAAPLDYDEDAVEEQASEQAESTSSAAEPDSLDNAHFNPSLYFGRAEREARKHYADAKLSSFSAVSLRADGTLDLNDEGIANWMFVSPSAAKKATGSMGACSVSVSAIDSGLSAVSVPLGACNLPTPGPPKCSVSQVIKKVLAGGSAKDITVAYSAFGTQGSVWSVVIDETNTHIVADDC